LQKYELPLDDWHFFGIYFVSAPAAGLSFTFWRLLVPCGFEAWNWRSGIDEAETTLRERRRMGDIFIGYENEFHSPGRRLNFC